MVSVLLMAIKIDRSRLQVLSGTGIHPGWGILQVCWFLSDKIHYELKITYKLII